MLKTTRRLVLSMILALSIMLSGCMGTTSLLQSSAPAPQVVVEQQCLPMADYGPPDSNFNVSLAKELTTLHNIRDPQGNLMFPYIEHAMTDAHAMRLADKTCIANQKKP